MCVCERKRERERERERERREREKGKRVKKVTEVPKWTKSIMTLLSIS